VRESFISFRAHDLGCDVVSDAAALIYRASRVGVPTDADLRACVFENRTLFRLAIESRETRTLPVRYKVRSAAGEHRSPRESRARHLVVRASPIVGEMGSRPTPVEVYLDEASGLPVRATLSVGDFGATVDVDLVEVVEDSER